MILPHRGNHSVRSAAGCPGRLQIQAQKMQGPNDESAGGNLVLEGGSPYAGRRSDRLAISINSSGKPVGPVARQASLHQSSDRRHSLRSDFGHDLLPQGQTGLTPAYGEAGRPVPVRSKRRPKMLFCPRCHLFEWPTSIARAIALAVRNPTPRPRHSNSPPCAAGFPPGGFHHVRPDCVERCEHERVAAAGRTARARRPWPVP